MSVVQVEVNIQRIVNVRKTGENVYLFNILKTKSQRKKTLKPSESYERYSFVPLSREGLMSCIYLPSGYISEKAIITNSSAPTTYRFVHASMYDARCSQVC